MLPVGAPALPGVAPVVPGTPAAAPVLPAATPLAPGAAPVLPTAAPGTVPVVAPVLPPTTVAPTPVPVVLTPGAAPASGPAVPLVDDALGGVVAAPIAPAPGPVVDPNAVGTDGGADGGADGEFDGDVTSADGDSPEASNGVPTNRLPQASVANLTAPDTFVYDFKVTDEDYIPPRAPLKFGAVDLRNMTALPAVPANVEITPPESPSRLLTWRQDILDHNKALWRAKANRKIDDAVTTLTEQADIYMRDPVYEATNKTVNAPQQGNVTVADLSRVYFSLSDYYWPHRVSSVNPNGLPYKYNPSVNLQVR